MLRTSLSALLYASDVYSVREAFVSVLVLGAFANYFKSYLPPISVSAVVFLKSNRGGTHSIFWEFIYFNEPSKAALLNHRFHEIIGGMAQNPYLVASLNRMLIDHTRLSQTFYRPASEAERVLVKKASDQHDAMISAIEAQETALVIDLTLQHWDLARDRMERFVKPDPLPIDVISLNDKRQAKGAS